MFILLLLLAGIGFSCTFGLFVGLLFRHIATHEEHEPEVLIELPGDEWFVIHDLRERQKCATWN